MNHIEHCECCLEHELTIDSLFWNRRWDKTISLPDLSLPARLEDVRLVSGLLLARLHLLVLQNRELGSACSPWTTVQKAPRDDSRHPLFPSDILPKIFICGGETFVESASGIFSNLTFFFTYEPTPWCSSRRHPIRMLAFELFPAISRLLTPTFLHCCFLLMIDAFISPLPAKSIPFCVVGHLFSIVSVANFLVWVYGRRDMI